MCSSKPPIFAIFGYAASEKFSSVGDYDVIALPLNSSDGDYSKNMPRLFRKIARSGLSFFTCTALLRFDLKRFL